MHLRLFSAWKCSKTCTSLRGWNSCKHSSFIHSFINAGERTVDVDVRWFSRQACYLWKVQSLGRYRDRLNHTLPDPHDPESGNQERKCFWQWRCCCHLSWNIRSQPRDRWFWSEPEKFETPALWGFLHANFSSSAFILKWSSSLKDICYL